MSLGPARVEPNEGVLGVRAYKVPRSEAPIDLYLDGNEGLGPPARLLEVLGGAEAVERLRRYAVPGELEGALARRFGVEPSQVLVTAGLDDAIDRLFRAMVGPGRGVVLPTPTFPMFAHHARLYEAELATVPWQRGPWPLEEVLGAIAPQTRMVPVVSPNNPTGACVTGAQLREAAARAPGVLWVVDQAYAEYGGEDLTEVALGLENAVVLRTFSKAWGLAGLRVGYVLGPAGVIEWLRAAGLPFAVSGPSLALAQAWLERGEGEVRRHVARVASERARLREVFEGLGCEAQPSEANFVLARVPDPVWLRDALAGLGVGIRVWPGSAELGDAARVTCPGEEGDFARLEAALGAALRPEALLLDMDGVMADVSASYRGAIVQTAARFGASVTAQDIAQAKARGGANDDWALTQRLLAERGVQVGLDEVTEVFEALYQGTDTSPGLRHTERLIGGRGLYEALAARVPLAVVTGRPRVDAERFLSEHGLGGLFGAVVCREDAPLKPDPAPVREALSRLGVSRAWMVGDTPDDVRAARSAGVVPLGVVAPGEAGAWEAGASVLRRAGAGRVLGRLDELVAMLGEAR